MAIIDALGRVLPVLLLFVLGAVLRRRAFLSESTIADLRRFVLAVTLPSALFLTFLRVSLELRYLPIVVIVFVACVGMLIAGPHLCRLVGVRSHDHAGPGHLVREVLACHDVQPFTAPPTTLATR